MKHSAYARSVSDWNIYSPALLAARQFT